MGYIVMSIFIGYFEFGGNNFQWVISTTFEEQLS